MILHRRAPTWNSNIVTAIPHKPLRIVEIIDIILIWPIHVLIVVIPAVSILV
jgi:hypothetical protein